MKTQVASLVRQNLELAKKMWSHKVAKAELQALRQLTEQYQFSVALGDLV